ncbi:MAG: UDP-N-acetylglucosamine 2-epimerase (non-hydrolyzing) [Acidobacteria bacterium]|nr:UDP-N-acetylglucosamine 2-epimerase (non-hydrolyzing) [Acidobacteriota bacterium]
MLTHRKRILLCLGTRPEIIKMAPVYRALTECGCEPIVVHTGQHQQGVKELYHFFGMPVHHELEIPRQREGLGHLTAQLIETLDQCLGGLKPEVALVQGDTTSAWAAALVAYYHRIPVGHIEAGLRTHRDYEPFPEEKNREAIARLATWNFAPTLQARHNLLAEGIAEAKIHRVGNTIVDAVRWAIPQVTGYSNGHRRLLPVELQLLAAQLNHQKLLLITAHRRENWGTNIANISQAVSKLLAEDSSLVAVWPLHANPQVQATVRQVLPTLSPQVRERFIVTDPLHYPFLIWLLTHAWLVLTDSGGIQEEASETKTPVLILRNTTERMELVQVGGGKLVGTEPSAIVHTVGRLLSNPNEYNQMRCFENPFGDGYAGRYIAEMLLGPIECRA